MTERMLRREFLTAAGRVVLVLPAAAFLASCGGSSSGMNDSGGGSGLTVTSSSALGHSHNLFVPADDVDNPPDSGVTLSTSSSSAYGIGSHSHMVALSNDQLTTIMNGGTVSVDTSTFSDHHHSFTIRMT
jgi:hypothetical protein